MTATMTHPLARDGWSREALLAHQRERLDALIAHAVAHSPYYRETLTSFADAPVLTKATLMREWDRIACDPALTLAGAEAHVATLRAEPYLDRFRIATTSGASGLRGIFAYGREDFAEWAAVSLRQLIRGGVRPDSRKVSIAARDAIHISKQILAVLTAGPSDAPQLHALTPGDEMVAALNAYTPDVLLGYSSVLGLLADEQLCGRLRIAPETVFCVSEPLTADIRARMRGAWGLEPGNVYAATEALIIAASVPASPEVLEVPDDLLVVEVVDANNRPVAPGETGEKVLVTNLANHALPLIRYEVADRVTLGDGPNPTGRPYSWLRAVEGRTNDTLRLPRASGGWMDVLPYRLGEPFARLPEVRAFQIDWNGRDLLARVVLRDGETTERVRAELSRALAAAGAAPVPISVVAVDELQREPGPAAKLKLIRSTA